MPVAVNLFNHLGGLENEEIYESLDGVDTTIDDSRAEALVENELVEEVDPTEYELRITTEAVENNGVLVSATVAYDTLKPRGHRPAENSWYKDVERFTVRFSDTLFDDGGFVILGGGRPGGKLLHLQDILAVSPDDYERVNLQTGTIEDIVKEDSQDSKTRTVADYDEYTEAATASGRVDETGSLGSDLESSGDTTWEMFESTEYDGTVGVGTDSIVFYGNIWSPESMMDYIEEMIIPRID